MDVNLRLQDEALNFDTEHIPVQDARGLQPLVQPALTGTAFDIDDEPSLLDKPSDALASEGISGEVEDLRMELELAVEPPPPPPVDYFQRQFKNAIL
ncbi:unnamed protein product, partial [Symbiodinium sp. CCMP2456]